MQDAFPFYVFASFRGIFIEIASSAIGLNFCATAAGIKRYKSMNKNKEKLDEIILLPQSKLNNLEVLISRVLINWNISYG